MLSLGQEKLTKAKAIIGREAAVTRVSQYRKMTVGLGFVLFSVAYTGIVFLSVLRQILKWCFVLVCFVYHGCKSDPI